LVSEQGRGRSAQKVVVFGPRDEVVDRQRHGSIAELAFTWRRRASFARTGTIAIRIDRGRAIGIEQIANEKDGLGGSQIEQGGEVFGEDGVEGIFGRVVRAVSVACIGWVDPACD
jgi:hypothetical protein